jgi:mRNA interferase HigB
MNIHLIRKETIEAYATANPQSRSSFGIWLGVLRYVDWKTPADIQATFGSADLLLNGTNRVVFNIGGNNYRLLCKYYFLKKDVRLYICWIGTHAEYTKLCRQGKQYTISRY